MPSELAALYMKFGYKTSKRVLTYNLSLYSQPLTALSEEVRGVASLGGLPSKNASAMASWSGVLARLLPEIAANDDTDD